MTQKDKMIDNGLTLLLYAHVPTTRTLGPFQRFAIWTQGCHRACPSCMTPDARDFDRGYRVDVMMLAREIVSVPDIEGITISGGEPFLQASALVALIDAIRGQRDLGVIVYTGFVLQELHQESVSKDRNINRLLERIDLLIDGPYMRELDDGLSLRGSSNQEVHILTGRYMGIARDFFGSRGRAVEMHVLEDGLMLVGIPGRSVLEKWNNRQLVNGSAHLENTGLLR